MPNKIVCLIQLYTFTFCQLSKFTWSKKLPHFSSILFSFYPYSALMFHALLLKSKTQIQESICKKIHTMTDKCKYSVFTKPSYKWFIFVTKILLASSATTFAHRRTSSSNTYWLIQAKSRLNVHTATFLVQQPVISRLTNWHILVKNLSLVYNATFIAHKLAT